MRLKNSFEFCHVVYRAGFISADNVLPIYSNVQMSDKTIQVYHYLVMIIITWKWMDLKPKPYN